MTSKEYMTDCAELFKLNDEVLTVAADYEELRRKFLGMLRRRKELEARLEAYLRDKRAARPEAA